MSSVIGFYVGSMLNKGIVYDTTVCEIDFWICEIVFLEYPRHRNISVRCKTNLKLCVRTLHT